MTTGRALAQVALREPMRAIGWQPRAAGWFTRPIAAGFLGVAAVGSVPEHSRPGTARITVYAGIRDEVTEQAVCHLCALRDEGYRQLTAVTGIGYLVPASSWREREIAPGCAGEVARDLASLVQRYAEPYLHRLSSDPAELLVAAQHSAAYSQATGACRVVVLLARYRGRDQATAFLRERIDVAAGPERDMAARARSWLVRDRRD